MNGTIRNTKKLPAESGVLNRQFPDVIKVPKKRTTNEITILIKWPQYLSKYLKNIF